MQPFAQVVAFTGDAHRLSRGRRLRGRQCGGVDVGSRGFREMGDEVGIADDRCTGAAQRLAEGDQAQWHVVAVQASGIDAAATGIAHHANGMRIVDVQRGLTFACDPGKRAQRRDIAIHREHPVAGEQRRTIGMRGELASGGVGVGMRIALVRATRKPRGIDQRGMVELVLHARVAVAQQCLHHGEVGHVAAAEQQGPRRLQPVGEFGFQRGVLRAVAADQVRGGTAGTFASRIPQRGDHARMLRQAEVVIAAEVQQLASIDLATHAVAPRNRATATPPMRGLALRAQCEHAFAQ